MYVYFNKENKLSGSKAHDKKKFKKNHVSNLAEKNYLEDLAE